MAASASRGRSTSPRPGPELRPAGPPDPFTTIFTASPVPIGLCEDGLFIAVNPALCELFGRSEEELLGSSTVPFTHPDDLHVNRGIEGVLRAARQRGERAVQVEKRYLRPDGEVVWAWLTVTMVPGPNGEEWTLIHPQDVTARKVAELALRRSEANLAAVNLIARRVQAGQDPRPQVVDSARAVSGAVQALLLEPRGARTGDDGDEAGGPAVLVVTAASPAGTVGTRVALAGPSVSAGAYRSGELTLVPDGALDPRTAHDPDGVAGASALLCTPLTTRGVVSAVLLVCWDHPLPGPDDDDVRAVLQLADGAAAALEHARVVAELEASAVTDALTGLPNRRGWEEHLARLAAVCERDGEPLTVAVLDLDHFKAYNDAEGHLAGDRLLREVAQLVRGELRAGDVVARWGGEEFTLALPSCSAQDAHVLLERVRLAVRRARSCSTGFATRRPGEPPAALLRRADDALYAAKQAGRDRVLQALEP
ncbi:sensor domain-containing diguanylate cyclase [Kineococcus indalonis]|uniref:sensor domain-containing diguanylate cyclase n=1 Tax=Kineococcus indalonis TaxID=2696566 RepID=UPI0014128A2A|nr:sensor domain-containing diguanylate cyclase [Kineococcus indalonis]NAZ84891.1 diguanylate cyclase [Kineococcus indalonis]